MGRDDVAGVLRDGCARCCFVDECACLLSVEVSGLGERSLVVAVCVYGNTGRVAIDVRGRERSRVCVLLPYLRRVLRARTFGGGYLLGECGAVLA